MVEPSGNKRRLQIEINFILTVSCLSQRVYCLGSTRTGPYATHAPSDSGRDMHTNPGPSAMYPCPVCARDVTSRGVSYRCTRCSGWVHVKCSGLLNAAQYRRNKDWACVPCSELKAQQSTPPPPYTALLPNKFVMTTRSTFYSSTDKTRSSIGEKQGQSGGYIGGKALVKIQEPLHPELHHSTYGPSPWP